MNKIEKGKKIFFSFIFICFLFFAFRLFIVGQLVAKGDSYLGYKMYKDAIRQYKKALLLDSGNSNIANWLGYAYECSGDLYKAFLIYKKNTENDPGNFIPYYSLGMLYVKDKNFETAEKYFNQAISIIENGQDSVRDDRDFYFLSSLQMLSICQERLGETKEAINTNEKILKYYPDNELSKKKIEMLHNKL